jgi:hypothetical protein
MPLVTALLYLGINNPVVALHKGGTGELVYVYGRGVSQTSTESIH